MNNFIEIELVECGDIKLMTINLSLVVGLRKSKGGFGIVCLVNKTEYETLLKYDEIKAVLFKLNRTPLLIKKESSNFKEVSEPLIKWLAENVHPHHTIIVTSTGAELLEGTLSHQTTEFLID